MPKFNLANFDKVSGSFQPIPDGNYNVQVTKCEEKHSIKGNAYLNWTLVVVDGDFAGRNLWFMTMLTPETALFKLKALVEAVGTGFDASGVDTDAVVASGKTIKAVVAVTANKDTGELRNEVVKVMKA